MKKIRIATRASKLAMTQSGHVRDMIKSVCPDAEISLVEISTKGDRDKTDFLHKVNSVGFFTSEVENALFNNEADVAVHSLKDLPTAITEGLTIAAIPKREAVCDAMVSVGNFGCVGDLPVGARVGTSSLRRIAQLKHIRSDLNCQPLRGNVETRVKKVKNGDYDAIILAQAGLNRLSISDCISAVLDPEEFVPAPGQGALAIQTRSEDREIVDLLAKIDDFSARVTSGAERLILAKLHGGCSIPLGVYCRVEGEMIFLTAVMSSVDGVKYVRKTAKFAVSETEKAAERIARELLESGGKEVLEDIRI